MSEIVAQLTDFRQRVLQADKLRLEGDPEGAEALMPSRDELIEAIKAYRQSLIQRAPARSSASSAKAQAAAIEAMENLSELFKK
jgi:hypothetical protein